jgi:hypothetical protein
MDKKFCDECNKEMIKDLWFDDKYNCIVILDGFHKTELCSTKCAIKYLQEREKD